MTRKDYVAIAGALNQQIVYARSLTDTGRERQAIEGAVQNMLHYLCPIFNDDNPNFDEDRFAEAVMKDN